MKKGNFTSLVLLSGALVFPASAEKVQLDQLPSDLQEKIRAQVGSNRVEDIDRQTRDGRTIYEVAFKDNGQHREVQIEHNAPAPAATASESAATSQKIPYEQLPENIRRVADSYVRNADVNDVDRQVKDGRTTYEIGYKLRDGGPQRELLLSENGQVLNQRANRVASSSTARRPSTSPSTSSTVSTLTYHQLPPSIRSVADARLSDGEVSQVQRFTQNRLTTYQINFKKEDGRVQQLVIAEDGRVVRDQFISASSVGSPGSIQWGSSSSAAATDSTTYDFVTTPVNLVNVEAVRATELPEAVERSVQGYTTTANIQEVNRGTWRGRDVYQVTYNDVNNQQAQLQLDANGQVIYDPRRANTASPTGNLLNNIGRAIFDNNN